MAVPGYVKELQADIKDMSGAIGRTEGAIIKIETTLSDTLPEIKSSLATLNGTVRKHETDLALQKQAHEDCPARKVYDLGNPGGGRPTRMIIDLTDNRMKVAVGGILGAPTLVLLLEVGKLAAQHFWGG